MQKGIIILLILTIKYLQSMKRYYLEINGMFVKYSESLETMTKYYSEYCKKHKEGVVRVYDFKIGGYILSSFERR